MSPPTASAEIRLVLASTNELNVLFERELRHRRVFIAGNFTLVDRQRCSLVIVDPHGAEFTVGAEAVYLKQDEPGAGVGLDLIGLDATRLTELGAFAQCTAEEPPNAAERPLDASPGPHNLYERIRKLSLRERDALARQGSLSERVALERTYGGSVWEALLQNSQLTLPEVARIAKNGTLPVPLVAIIVSNGGWLASGDVRRALLSNPRASGAHLDRVLKAMPRAELRQLAQMSPYRAEVRVAAKKLIG